MAASRAGESGSASFAVGFGRDLLSGGLSGIVSKTVAAPVERVKLLLQTQQVNRDLATQYTGAIDCARRVYREQGPWSFWRGNVANLLRYFPSQALSFAFKDLYKDLMGLGGDGSSSSGSGGAGAAWWFIGGNLLAAGTAGGTAMVLLYPLEMARTRMAADVSGAGQARRFSGAHLSLSTNPLSPPRVSARVRPSPPSLPPSPCPYPSRHHAVPGKPI